MGLPEKSRLTILKSPELARDIADFLTDREARGLSPRTVQFYHDELANLRAFLQAQGITETEAITATALRGFLLDLGKRRNAGGVHCAYRVAKTFLRWYEAEAEPPDWRNPIAKVHPPKLSQEPLDPVDLADVRKMLGTCTGRDFTDARDRAAIMGLLDTGARASEFLGLDVADVDRATGAAIIRKGKGGKGRATFLGKKSLRALGTYLRYRPAASGPLWVTQTGTRLTITGLRSMLRRRARLAGVPAPGIHDFRRGFAIAALRGGCDLVSLQRLLGHADLSVIRRYLAQTQGDLHEAHNRAAPVDRLL
jgi:site-specific recombinase XerD